MAERLVLFDRFVMLSEGFSVRLTAPPDSLRLVCHRLVRPTAPPDSLRLVCHAFRRVFSKANCSINGYARKLTTGLLQHPKVFSPRQKVLFMSLESMYYVDILPYLEHV